MYTDIYIYIYICMYVYIGDCWDRLLIKEYNIRWENDQASTMGHSWTRKI